MVPYLPYQLRGVTMSNIQSAEEAVARLINYGLIGAATIGGVGMAIYWFA
jgi:hypothetical protein